MGYIDAWVRRSNFHERMTGFEWRSRAATPHGEAMFHLWSLRLSAAVIPPLKPAEGLPGAAAGDLEWRLRHGIYWGPSLRSG